MADLKNLTKQEENLGITKENFEKRFLFNSLKERFLTSEGLEEVSPDSHENIYLPIDW